MLAGAIEELDPGGGLKPVDGLKALTGESRSVVPEDAANAIRRRAISRAEAGFDECRRDPSSLPQEARRDADGDGEPSKRRPS